MRINRVKKKGRFRISGTVHNIAALISVFAVAIIAYLYIHMHPMKPIFPIKHVAFVGNKHLTDDELKAFAGVRLNDSLFAVSGGEVGRRLLRSPWVRSANVRREFPDRLSIMIKEAEPFALLNMNEHLFLIDEQGKLLEELKDDSVPFLPVISGDPFKENVGYSEALNLVKLMNAKGFSSERDRVEVIAHKAHELSVRMDETVIKMGVGDYEGKIERLVQLEEKIKKIGIHVDYIDLRFADRAIVKPVTDQAVKK